MEKIAAHYFALDHPLEKMRATFPDDPAMNAACRRRAAGCGSCGSRTGNASRLSSRARRRPSRTSRRFRTRCASDTGARCEWNGERLFSYPEPAAMAALDEEDLRACALGYRAKNLLRTARMIAGGEVDFSERRRTTQRRRRGARIAAARRRRAEGRGVRAALRLRAARGVPD